jgi:deoxyribodipyrimidine photo-lyase
MTPADDRDNTPGIPPFEPTPAAAHALLAAVQPGDYARTRNHLQGAVTRLSPYITHGVLTLPEVLAAVRTRHRVDAQHKFVYELGWRAFFHHVWQHEGSGIFQSLHAGVLPDDAYAKELPADIRQGATGVPVVDRAVRQLYATGWLHNHARMWLASYVVHLRKVHWRAGADWLYGHLLDGDLASNHLSWQWVAGTGSHKPYLFNAENVARFAPPAWHSPRTPVDSSYEALDALARSPRSVRVAGGPRVQEPPLFTTPPPGLALDTADTPDLPARAWLLHPWALRAAPAGQAAVGVFSAAFHAAWPWSAARWQFAAGLMAAHGAPRLWLAAPPPTGTVWVHDPHLAPYWPSESAMPAPRLFEEPPARCRSFSQYFSRVAASVSIAD